MNNINCTNKDTNNVQPKNSAMGAVLFLFFHILIALPLFLYLASRSIVYHIILLISRGVEYVSKKLSLAPHGSEAFGV